MSGNKPIYKSKTFWANLAYAILAAIYGSFTGSVEAAGGAEAAGINPQLLVWMGTGQVLLNTILRLVTNGPASITGK